MTGRCSRLFVALVLLGITGTSCGKDESIACTECEGACVDTRTDSDHCGACGVACDAGQTCDDGECRCVHGTTECDGACVETSADPANCGDCGVACGDEEVCSAGECAVECAEDLTDCDGACENTLESLLNCGDCGVECAPGQLCLEGECTCTDGLTQCKGECVDTRTDDDHCGTCDVACAGGTSCSSGSCMCPEGQAACDGHCVPEGDCETNETSTSTSAGMGGAGGTSSTSTSQAGATGSGDCVFSIEDELSTAIATVGIVSFSASNISLEKAEIEFTRAAGGPTYVAPVDLGEPNHRTLLLGMKGETDYEYRVILNDGECTSPTRTITTGPVSNRVPSVSKDRPLPEAVAPGFLVTSAGIGGQTAPDAPAFILDSDGDVVWWSAAPASCSRAKLDWEGTHMYMMMLNVRYSTTGGNVRRVSMDGLSVEDKLSGLTGGHHDFTVTPGGNIVAIVHQNECSGILERSPSGEITSIVDDVHTLYEPVGDCHPNSIHYHPEDDSFTLSDRNPDLFVKISRTGELEWQFGGTNPLGSVHYQGTWNVNHGHQLLPNGHFLFFNNGGAARQSPVLEYELTEPEATLVWSYTSDYVSGTLGDVQRLPNGNTLITYSNAGVILEIDGDSRLVQQFSLPSVGYVEHRASLYGPPPR